MTLPLNTTVETIVQSTALQELLHQVEQGKTCSIFGLPKCGRAVYYSALWQKKQSPLTIVVPNDAEASKLSFDLYQLCGARVVILFGRDLVLGHIDGQNHSHEHRRIEALGKMVGKRCDILLVTAETFLQPLLPKDVFCEFTTTLTVGADIPLKQLMHKLIVSGYVRRDNVEAPGQFALRGGIFDVYSPDLEKPLRCEFWGDTLEQMSTFDVVSQRREDKVKKAHISPAREVLFDDTASALDYFERHSNTINDSSALKSAFSKELHELASGIMPASTDKFYPIRYPKPGTVFDYMPDSLLCCDDFAALVESCKTAAERNTAQITSLAGIGEISDELLYYKSKKHFTDTVTKRANIFFESFERTLNGVETQYSCNIKCHQLPLWAGSIASLEEEVGSFLAKGYHVRVLAGTRRAANAIEKELNFRGISATANARADYRGNLVVVQAGNLSGGAEFVSEKYCVISGRRSDVISKPKKRPKGLASLSDISPGDYVVHQNHGIGRYVGIENMELHGVVKDYIKLDYAKGDNLYIPVTQLDLLSRFTAKDEGDNVKLSRLGGADWNRTKSKVRTATAEMAKELIELYAKRLKTPGFAFAPDEDWQADFEERFAYEETDDQLRAIREIKRDMHAAHCMDRLLCGDVGVGKTEVALRAAFKCIMNGKQVALLCPTTILAMQHFNTVCERMETFSVKPSLMSRFNSTKVNNNILKGLSNGSIDIVVGTHKLLQKSVKFKQLGLLIVDEEQRFGVTHKERLKEMFVGVDVLTMSATPIPRTLNMALSGIRDLSSIDEPPGERLPIETYVMEYDERQVVTAIERELSRGGQVYYLHNRIDTIDGCAERLSRLLPGATIETAHGRMDEKQLSAVWGRLLSGELDVLVCTTIIETGVDVRNCNTLIIEDADRLGLSQLYQMRGRVGRSSRKAYAYFTFRANKIVNEVAEKRLSAIREFTSFGSGFRIAMRDLQIRGAGNLLGKSQSGHLSSVGYEMYMKLLNQAIALQKGEEPQSDKSECLIDISSDAFIPKNYIPDSPSRIEIYRRIAAIETQSDADEIMEELKDRYGAVPKSAEGLCDISLLRVQAAKLHFYEINQKGDSIICYTDRYAAKELRSLFNLLPKKVGFTAGSKPYIWLRPDKNEDATSILKVALAHLESLVYNNNTASQIE